MRFRRLSRRLVLYTVVLVPLAAGLGLLLWPAAEDPLARRPREGPTAAATTTAGTAGDMLVMDDGRILLGEVLRQGPDEVALRSPSGRVELVPRRSIRSLQLGMPRRGPPTRLHLRSGRVVTGQLLASSEELVEVRLESGNMVTLRRSDVTQMEPLAPD